MQFSLTSSSQRVRSFSPSNPLTSAPELYDSLSHLIPFVVILIITERHHCPVPRAIIENIRVPPPPPPPPLGAARRRRNFRRRFWFCFLISPNLRSTADRRSRSALKLPHLRFRSEKNGRQICFMFFFPHPLAVRPSDSHSKNDADAFEGRRSFSVPRPARANILRPITGRIRFQNETPNDDRRSFFFLPLEIASPRKRNCKKNEIERRDPTWSAVKTR